ncbi:MAG: putative ABC transporter ATP-binding protein YheS [Proteobacteria bacterium]|nr:MAG: putative ABC transporter ATP-binding protein YheS [Pseudomonadota bacterium]
MLNISGLTYRIAGRTILEDASLRLQDNWKIGVVGANGVGKSTLFKLISGELVMDSGEIDLPVNAKFGWVKQDIPSDNTTLLDVVLSGDEERAKLMVQSETETDPYKLAEVHTRLMDIDAYSAPAKAATILNGLGFKEEELSKPISDFSGGWRMRVALAAALLNEPDLLLLDEPTNHLDIEAIMWLEEYLVSYPHTLLIISHDRDLLNKCADHIVHIENHKLVTYTGNYDSYEKERAEKRMNQQKLHEKQMAHKAHLEAYINRFKAKASKAKQAQSRVKQLEKMDIVSAVMAERAKPFIFPKPEELSPPILSIDKASVGYEKDKPILTGVNERIDMDDRIALLGANGNGKSTLIKLIANRLAPMAGEVERHNKLRIGYFSQHQAEELDLNATAYDEMKRKMKGKDEKEVRGLLGKFGFNKELSDNRIDDLSGGEKSRLLFALMSYDAPHLILLDEPINHLDMDAREGLVQALNNYNGAVILVSHDPSMVEKVADRLWLVKDGECQPYDGDIDAYRKLVIEERREEKKAEKQAKPKKEGVLSKKELRQIAAKKRKAYPAEYKAMDEAEKKVKALAKEKRALEAQMAEPGFFDNQNLSSQTQMEHENVQVKLEDAEVTWLDLTEKYENLSV